MQYQYRRNPYSNLFGNSVVNKIVIANVIVFFLQIILSRTGFQDFFALYPRDVIFKGYIWQLVTYMFLHGSLSHIFFNMIVIWMFGTTLEQVWGSRRFLKYYFICGLGGAVFSFIFSFNVPVIGASAAGYGILLAYAVLFPYNQIYIWGIIPIRARTLVIILGAVSFVFGIAGGGIIAHFAHLGGMAAGLIYLKNDHRSRGFFSWLSRLWDRFPLKISFEKDQDDKRGAAANDADKIDSILDKISEKGYENLSETEKRILERYSDKGKDL
ncbi:MAG: rhomboid family intramembrane serine protease [Candidatus Krumholzibacteriota bacterium]|nr:rhomboid family intramembrane serine protease [Candidatus Krumholzibacteriota bacterium]